jgi:TonB family protein
LRKFDEGIAACDHAIQLQPVNAQALRDRGHYKLNLGRIDDAQHDLERSEELNPSDRGTYYHLGLAHYFKGEFKESAAQFQGCARNSKEKVDVLECDAWLYPSLFRAGEKAEAQRLLDGITPDPSIAGHPAWYLDRLLLFKGAKTEDQVAANLNSEGALSLESIGYSIGLWHLLSGREAKAREYYQKVLSGDMPFAWGYRAARADLSRIGSAKGYEADKLNAETLVGSQIYRVGGGVSAPRVIFAPDPKYSDEAREAKVEGKVVLWCVVDKNGDVRDIKVARTLGHGLDARAVEAVKEWKFQPATKDGAPVPVEINVEVNFRLR